jgi:hypothetical protein
MEQSPLDIRASAALYAARMQIEPRLKAGKVHSIGKPFAYPLGNPETRAMSRTFLDSGRILGILEEGGRNILLEAKTTGDSLDPESDYWQRLAIDSSVSRQTLGALSLGIEVHSVLYLVFRRTMFRPAQIPKLDEKGLKIVLDARGQRVLTQRGEPRQSADANQGYTLQTDLETAEAFEARLFDRATCDPGEFFAWREEGRIKTDLLEYISDAWSQGQRILWCRKNGFSKNSDACKSYGSTCEYLPLCSKRANIDGITFKRALQPIPGEKTHLTDGALRAIRRCERYYELAYEQGVKRVREEEDEERLAFGITIQRKVRQWLLAFNNQPVNHEPENQHP